ncbi:MAG: hypothetical protein C4519_20355 [Desulfobacteraceae bacterium]|nr:MAG: hypothetical protein C4519_20355 [Desulfobacteraceae bacterium]
MKSRGKKKETGFFGKGQRYWSIMLVGEHGRVIPFRRFKEIAMAVTAVALLSSLALVVLGIFYFYQGRAVERLQGEVDRWQHQAKVLKDEKDVLKAQLVINSIKTAAEAKSSPPQKPLDTVAGQVVHATALTQPGDQASQVSADPPAPQKQANVQWQAEIRHFEVHYDSKAELLTARVGVYNTSIPKQPLSGRIVLAFRANDDPPIKWITVPKVSLADGKPHAQSGHLFSVRNHRTLELKADGQKAPIAFNNATVYVFSKNGELLLARDFDFTIPSDRLAPAEPPPSEPKQNHDSANQSKAPAGASAPLREDAGQQNSIGGPEKTRELELDAPADLPLKSIDSSHPKPEGERP